MNNTYKPLQLTIDDADQQQERIIGIRIMKIAKTLAKEIIANKFLLKMTLASRQFHCMQEKPLLEKAIFLTRCRLNNVSNSRHACLKSNSAVTISIMQRKVQYFNSHLSRISISIKRANIYFLTTFKNESRCL